MRRRSPTAGFTLVEVLAALAILSVGLLAVTRGLVTARGASDGASVRAGAARLAGELTEGPEIAGLTGPGELSGQRDGLTWRLAATPLEPPLPEPSGDKRAAWTPFRVDIGVTSANGAVVRVRTVRLIRTEPQ